MQVLIVGGPSEPRDALAADLDTQGLTPETVDGVPDAVAAGTDNGYAAVLVMLDRPDTLVDDLRVLRERLGEPMMVLLPRTDDDADGGDTHHLAAALDAGADDALAAPYDREVLFARLRALVRRCGPGAASVVRFEDLELDYDAHRVTRAGQDIKLTAKEFDLLTLFMTRPRRVLSREEIARHAWDRNFDAFSNVIEVIISRLRKKIDQPFDTPYLHTVVNRGYMLSVTPPTE